jgi:ERCC4-related helicase
MKELQNIKPRKYQQEIYETCLKKNCLVVLPTGLGKTLIALMLSIQRIKDFPLKKILILAPTKPLAEQHLESFTKNLPELWADIELFTGKVKPEKRKKIWNTASIIFSTPQCIANDLKNNLYNLKEVSLLIEDEAHRCVKNYDYNYIAKKYFKESTTPRLVGLTASPGSDTKKIKEICENLSIEEVELRTRNSSDVIEYLQELEFNKKELELPKEFNELRTLLKQIYVEYTEELRKKNFLFGPDNKISLIELQKKLIAQMNRSFSNPQNYIAMSLTAQAIKLSHAIELLETQTLESFMKYLKNIFSQAEKKQSRGVVKLANRQDFNYIYAYTSKLLEAGQEHPKVEEIIRIIRDEKKENKEMKTIVFTQFRDTANIISKNLNKLGGIKSKVFVGQTKKNGIGLSQKDQKKMIDEFREKKINVLCATCIAEEGLDIPEVNSVIFYEPVSSAIRSIQRRGRTARLSKGKLIILLTKNTKDEYSYYASRSREKKMEKSIQTIKNELKLNGKLNSKKAIQKKLF